MELGKKHGFYFVCKFIYHTLFFEMKKITLCDESSFFPFFFL